MWDLTPDTDLLAELPDDYTFETALADLIVSLRGCITKIIFCRAIHPKVLGVRFITLLVFVG